MSKYFDTKPGSLEEATKAVTLKEDDVQAKMRQLMRRDGKDPDRVSDGGVFDRYRQMAKRELGIRDQKEQKLNEDDVQAKARQLMRRDGKDPDRISDGGVFQRYRDMAKRELGIRDQKEQKLDPVNPKAAAKKFDDRKDKDIDNDGDVDDSDKFLHKRRKAIGKSMKETVLDIWKEAASKSEMAMGMPGMSSYDPTAKKKKDNKKAEQKKTDTGMPMTPVDMSPKMPKMKNEKNKV